MSQSESIMDKVKSIESKAINTASMGALMVWLEDLKKWSEMRKEDPAFQQQLASRGSVNDAHREVGLFSALANRIKSRLIHVFDQRQYWAFKL